MIFSSIPFLFFFFPIFLILYYLIPYKFKNTLLLIFSLIFYAWGEPVYVILMIFSCLLNYYSALFIERYNNDKYKKKLFLIISIIVNIGLLGFFKYGDFILENINTLFNLNMSLLKIGLPIGISFFTFQTMSYTIDVYRGEVKANHNFFTFTTYVSMFPQLIAGPIVRYETVEKELKQRTINFEKYCSGLKRFLDGVFKKVLLANNIGFLWNIISSNSNNAVLTAWLGLIAFSLQIYFDFSGYSDMAIGMGKMLGFEFLENFNYPYISKSITDFWRRWHISLSTWFKDYVYIPLGGSRCKKTIIIRNILIVWMLTGIWHGAAFNFIIWGLYFGVILVLEKFVLKKYIDKLPDFMKHIYSILLIMIGWLIFAFDDMDLLFSYTKSLLGINTNLIDNNFMYYFSNYFIIIALGILFSIPIYPYLKEKIKNSKVSHIILIFIYVLLFIITISLLVSDTYNPFLYFRF
ncbi:MAG: MBOAT family O-acyltransferase [Bacilli bacterium]